MTLAEPDNYIAVNSRMLEQANGQAAWGTFRRRPKGLGTAAHYMKAVAKHCGWQNGSHRDFFTIKDRLANETNDPGMISLLFREANALHQNFYEPLYLPSDVRGGIDSAKEFIGLLEEAAVLREPPTDTLNGTG